MRVSWVSPAVVVAFAVTVANVLAHQSAPYLDGNKLCQDEIKMMEDVKYDEEIRCNVRMKRICDDAAVNAEDAMTEACHTVYKKECQISYRPEMTKVKVRVCPGEDVKRMEDEGEKAASYSENSLVIDIRPTPPPAPGLAQKQSDCLDGVRRICVTKYETECQTEMVRREMAEDHPKCRVQLVESCADTDDGEKRCKQMPAMRCRIEKRMVVKTKPETKCRRVPRQFCRKEECKNDDHRGNNLKHKCYFRTQTVNEIIPEEKCYLRPERMCHGIRRRRRNNQIEGGKCSMEPEERCTTRRVNPRPVMKKMRRRNCKIPSTKEDFRVVKAILDGQFAENLDFEP